MIADFHIHIEEPRYSRKQIDALLSAGLKRGISQFGITEHVHCFRESRALLEAGISTLRSNSATRHMEKWWLRHARKSLLTYADFVLKLQGLGYPIKLGLEVDFIPGTSDLLRQIVAGHPWDFLLGSVHWLNGWGFDFVRRPWSWRGKDLSCVYDQYFALVCEAARTGFFDVIAHFDLIKIMGSYEKDYVRPSGLKAISSIAKAGVAVEVNTAGLRKPVGEVYPGPALLRQMVKAGISFTIGSDAHRPEDVGRDFDIAVNMLKASGVEQTVIFDKRIGRRVSL